MVGFAHSFLSTLFAYGAVLHSVILHAGLSKRQVTGMGVFKVTGYAMAGFDYW